MCKLVERICSFVSIPRMIALILVSYFCDLIFSCLYSESQMIPRKSGKSIIKVIKKLFSFLIEASQLATLKKVRASYRTPPIPLRIC